MRTVLTAFMLFALNAMACTQQSNDPNQCFRLIRPSIPVDFDQRIQGCTLVIHSTRSSDLYRSRALNNRGNAYLNKGEIGRAMDDYDRALQLDPNSVRTFINRGAVHHSRGEYDLAIRDYDQALHLDPDNAELINRRGRARFYLGRFREAQWDLVRVVENKPEDAIGVISLYLARARAGQDGRAELERNSRRLKLDGWPGSVVQLYLGTATSVSVLSAARDSDPMKELERHCVAYFHLGQQALLGGDDNEAMRLFKATIATCVTNSIEYSGAKAELRRLEHR